MVCCQADDESWKTVQALDELHKQGKSGCWVSRSVPLQSSGKSLHILKIIFFTFPDITEDVSPPKVCFLTNCSVKLVFDVIWLD